MTLDFLEYLAQAQLEALQDRESQIIELRYGLTGEKAATLAAIGQVFGVSRERIRQLLGKAHRKLYFKGQRQIKADNINAPCAELLIFLRSIIRPQEPNSVERFLDFCRIYLSCLPQKTHAFPLVAYLTYPEKKSREKILKEAKKIFQQFEAEKRKNYKKLKLLSDFQALLSYIIYPKQLQLLKEMDFRSFSRKREVSLDGEGISGSFYSKKLSRLVQYESSLEMNFLLCLEYSNDVIFYQEQPVRIPYNYKKNSYFYYPDFLFVLKNGTGIITEIKPVFKMALQENLTKWSALKAYCSQHGLGLLVTDGRYSIQQIQRHEVKPEFSSYVLEKLCQGNMNWSEYKKIKEQFNPSRNDFVALVLKNKLVWKLSPFFLGFQL
ncbi:MAG: sigma factor-like helix-turn-helix DNA-binding protein [Cyanobacteriota bacterium]|nr:sigma factor-like helix-turn-helix DNA-binding protein [Cyanobacteriota bacterium]